MLTASLAYKQEHELQMEIWDNPHLPGFKFQQYRALDENKVLPYEALAVLKNPDGSNLTNNCYFDHLREMAPEWQIAADRFLVPLALKAAAEKKRLPVAVNIHLATLFAEGFLDTVRSVMKEYGLSQGDVALEIVEPHVPTREQAQQLQQISRRTNPEDGFTLIIDDHDFETGHDRLRMLAPHCDMVKINMDQAPKGYAFLKEQYPHLSVVLERVTFNDRDAVFALYPGVSVQGI